MPDKQSVLDDYEFIRDRLEKIRKERETPAPETTIPTCELCPEGMCNGLCGCCGVLCIQEAAAEPSTCGNYSVDTQGVLS